MLNRKSPHLTLAVVVTVAAILMAGGAAIASNAGFKMNMPIWAFTSATSVIGNNWVSLPYFNPYVTCSGLCTQTGLASGVSKATLTMLDPVAGVFNSVQCGTSACNTFNLSPQFRAVRIRQPAAVTPNPFSIIVVGSHNPALQTHLEDQSTVTPSGPFGANWVSVPYHTTAANFQDFCNSSGLTQAPVLKATLAQFDPQLGSFTSAQCGTSGATSSPLVLGRGLRILEPNGPKDYIAAHF